MFNLKTTILRYTSHFKLSPVEFIAENEYTIVFKEDQSEEVNCTNQIGLVGLKPLTFAFSFSNNGRAPHAKILIRKKNKVISEISLVRSELQLSGYVFYHIQNSTNYIQTTLSKMVGTIGLHVKNRLQPNTNFTMRPKHLKQLFDFCLYPRPVYILSGINPNETLSFPLDVIGMFDEGKVLFSIRKTNRSNSDIQKYRKILLSRIPYEEREKAYILGKNSTKTLSSIKVNYEIYSQLSYPSFVFHTMHLSIDSFCEIGEHYCYSSKIIGRINKQTRSQLAHVPWFALFLFE
jgi:hypothetical protein